MKVLGIETEHAGKVFEGTERDISTYLQSMGFKETHKVGHDLFFMKKQYIGQKELYNMELNKY